MTDIKTVDEKRSEIDQQVKDIVDYLCSRGDTMHLRDEIECRARRMLFGLSIKGWVITRAENVKKAA